VREERRRREMKRMNRPSLSSWKKAKSREKRDLKKKRKNRERERERQIDGG